MSGQASRSPSPSSTTRAESYRSISTAPTAPNQQSTPFQDFATTPQSSTARHSQSDPELLAAKSESGTQPSPSNPEIIVTEPRQGSPNSESGLQDSRPLVSRHRTGKSSSLPLRRSASPYSRPRSRSQPRTASTVTAMSSASSSPGNTSTAGSSSGSGNPGYNLPYAPFPYPMPANPRGSSNQKGGSSK